MPIVVNADGVVLDGHHRYRACNELDIEPRTEVRRFAEPLLEKKFVIEANLKRRHLTDFQKAVLGHVLEPIERELAKRRQIEAGKNYGRGKENTTDSIPSFDGNRSDKHEGETVNIVAKQVGLCPTTYQRAKTIIEKAPEELKERVRSGETSINYAYKQVNRAQDHKETPALPQGQFNRIKNF